MSCRRLYVCLLPWIFPHWSSVLFLFHIDNKHGVYGIILLVPTLNNRHFNRCILVVWSHGDWDFILLFCCFSCMYKKKLNCWEIVCVLLKVDLDLNFRIVSYAPVFFRSSWFMEWTCTNLDSSRDPILGLATLSYFVIICVVPLPCLFTYMHEIEEIILWAQTVSEKMVQALRISYVTLLSLYFVFRFDWIDSLDWSMTAFGINGILVIVVRLFWGQRKQRLYINVISNPRLRNEKDESSLSCGSKPPARLRLMGK